MPVITINALCQPPTHLMREIAEVVAIKLEVSPDRVWAFWNQLDKNAISATPWLDQSQGGVVINFRCKSHYPQNRVQEVISDISRYVSEQLNISDDAILAIIDRVQSGQLFVKGEFWYENAASGDNVALKRIATVHNSRKEVIDDNWGNVRSRIELDGSRFTEEALVGLEQFSHLECIFFLHMVQQSKVHVGARHPRNLKHLPRVGIFAQRPKARPNRLGLSVCRIVGVDRISVEVEGLDAIDGTPVLDIKPYFSEFGPRGQTVQPDWVAEIMKNYF